MKTLIDIENWDRKELYYHFSKFDEPFLGVTVSIDCTKAYHNAKRMKCSFFLYYLYRALKVANEIENFRYRIIDNQVYLFDKVNASCTIGRVNNMFGFSHMDYEDDEELFYKNALTEIKRVQNTTDLLPLILGENVIHFSAVPWIDFSSISHARNYSGLDCSPKISFGKIVDIDGVKKMAVSVHAHHGLIDGYHVGLFVDRFQKMLDEV